MQRWWAQTWQWITTDRIRSTRSAHDQPSSIPSKCFEDSHRFLIAHIFVRYRRLLSMWMSSGVRCLRGDLFIFIRRYNYAPLLSHVKQCGRNAHSWFQTFDPEPTITYKVKCVNAHHGSQSLSTHVHWFTQLIRAQVNRGLFVIAIDPDALNRSDRASSPGENGENAARHTFSSHTWGAMRNSYLLRPEIDMCHCLYRLRSNAPFQKYGWE